MHPGFLSSCRKVLRLVCFAASHQGLTMQGPLLRPGFTPHLPSTSSWAWHTKQQGGILFSSLSTHPVPWGNTSPGCSARLCVGAVIAETRLPLVSKLRVPDPDLGSIGGDVGSRALESPPPPLSLDVGGSRHTWADGRVVALSLLPERAAALGAVGRRHAEPGPGLPALPTGGRTHAPGGPLLSCRVTCQVQSRR